MRRAIEQPFGSVVVVGPTGSGKTTTLYACLQELNSPEQSLVTLEDPVEYRAAGLDQIEINPRAGLTFASGLRTILRSDPDIVLVGEIRDEETAQIAFRAAMTGHLVLTTLHAQSAAAASAAAPRHGCRARSHHDGDQLLRRAAPCAEGVRACAEKYEPTEDELRAVGMPTAMSGVILHRAMGCATCSDIGYKGRVPLFEVLPVTERIASLVSAPTREIEAAAVAEGMLRLRDDGLRLCIAGVTTLDEIGRVAGHGAI